MKALLILLLCVICCTFAEIHRLEAGADGLVVDVNTADGSYAINVDGEKWFTSGPTALHSAGTWYTSGSNLKLISSAKTSGTDVNFGTFTAVTIKWQAGSIPFETGFIVFDKHELVLFTQYFAEGVSSTAVTNNNNTVVASFPTLPASSAADLYYYTYTGTFANPHVGRWVTPNFPGGVTGGSPVLFYNTKFRSLVFSPADNFMTGAQVISKDLAGNLAFGLNAKILQIPVDWRYTTVLVGGQGIGHTLYTWGEVLLISYGKKRTTLDADILIKSLGYWTDNGAYYYYLTEPGKDYGVTMVDVKNYLTQQNIPVTNYQFDSWWYFKGANGGVTIWEPMPSIFPDGMAPVTAKLGAPVSLHNRWFAPDSPYIKNYTFIVEGYAALPAEQAIFDHIMGKAKSWGMVLYEQDWLVTTYTTMIATQNNVTNARNWLLYMGKAAAKLGVTIQYCMPLPNHLLQSVEIPAVTQSRASGDYNPSNTNWHISYTSQLIWSLGMVPFKDDFWTTSSQPGCKYSLCVEYTPKLVTLVAALSAGPVGPSDAIGKADRELIMRTCKASGELLKADVPATPVDSVFLPQANGQPSLIQVSASWSEWGPYRWYYLLGADLSSAFTVTTSDLPIVGGPAKYIDYFLNLNGTAVVNDFDATHPIKIPARTSTTGPISFNYYVIAPILESGWVLFGETGKFITVADQRIVGFATAPSQFTVTLIGTPLESVTLTVLNTLSPTPTKLQQFTFTIPSTSSVRFTCTRGASGSCTTS